MGSIKGQSSRNGSQKNLDDWGDWEDESKEGGSSGHGEGGFSGKSEYTRSQLEASAAGKESFFARKMEENATRPDHLPPSQGGKYVGFGSSPMPPSSNRGAPAGAAGVDDVTAMFSKGLSSLTKVAEVAASTAASTVKAGTQSLSRTLQEKQVGEVVSQNAKFVQEKAAQVAQVTTPHRRR
jgi:ADP-ribosylation factor GTPase-activating protein 1